jgi:uncharacterized protein YkwD
MKVWAVRLIVTILTAGILPLLDIASASASPASARRGSLPAAQVPGSLPAAQVPGSLPAAQVPGSLPAAQTPASAEIRFLELLNSERAARGLSRLARSTALDAVARSWSTTMSVNGLAHRGDLAVQMTLSERGWRRAGENVGYGSDVEALHRAFVNSPAHFDNVVGDWTKVGVGVVVVGDTTWVTFNFVKSPPAVVRKSRKATRVEK